MSRVFRSRIAAVATRASVAGLLLAAQLTFAGTPRAAVDDAEALRFSQAAIGRQLAGYDFSLADGTTLRLDALRGRPVLLSLVYTSCYQICSGLTLKLRESVRIARDVLGKDAFAVVTVGFDTPNDTPQRMRAYARERGVDLPLWYFAAADAGTMTRLAGEVGFSYAPSPKGFDHITQTTLIDASGRIALQVYGADFAPPVLVEPLKKLVWGRELDRSSLRGLLNTVRLVCTIYDPSSGRYRFDYSLIVNIVSGALALGIAAVGILAALRNVR